MPIRLKTCKLKQSDCVSNNLNSTSGWYKTISWLQVGTRQLADLAFSCTTLAFQTLDTCVPLIQQSKFTDDKCTKSILYNDGTIWFSYKPEGQVLPSLMPCNSLDDFLPFGQDNFSLYSPHKSLFNTNELFLITY